ncbi:MAG: solute carrier family 23 protein [Rhodospirillaceae bacterium]
MRPANLLYGVDDRPPWSILVLSTAQQTAATAAISFATLIAVLDAAHADLETTSNALRVSMLALGLVTLLQCLRWRQIGTGYLVPAVFATSYLPGMLLAAREGGLPLVFGMTMLAGVAQALMSFTLPRLRPYFPTEITGFVVFMIGLGMGMIGVRAIAGASPSGVIEAHADAAILGVATLAVIITASVWSRGSLRTFSVLIGIVCGYIIAAATGQLDLEALAWVWFGSPFNLPSVAAHLPAFSFSLSLVLPFVIGALACSLRTIGDVTTAQKINDANWRRPDMSTIEGGILACGLGNILAGLLGSIGSNSSSSGVGLSGVTGVTSRQVGYAMAGLMAFLSFSPGLAMALAVMPRPVLGAVMLFTGCLVIMNGLSMIMSRVIDMRKTVVVGVSMVLGIGHDIFPQLFLSAPTWVQPFVESSVVLSILAALLLNGLFRLGVRKVVATGFSPGPEAAEQMYRFLQGQGGIWAARQEVIQRAIRGVSEFAEVSPLLVEPGDGVAVTAAFDEYLLTIEIAYRGKAFEISRVTPTEDELLEDEGAMVRLASILMARSADRVSIRSDESSHRVLLSFNH